MDFFISLISSSAHDMSIGRIFESLVVYAVVWNRIKPQIQDLTKEVSDLKNAVSDGFKSGENRFEKIETRLHDVELEFKNTKEAKNGNFSETNFARGQS